MAAGVRGPGCKVALSDCTASRGVVGAVEGVFEGNGGEGGHSDFHQVVKIGGVDRSDVDAGWWRFRCRHGGRGW